MTEVDRKKVIRITETTEGPYVGMSYSYVTGVNVDKNGRIQILTANLAIDAMMFMNTDNIEINRTIDSFVNMVKTYFPKRNYKIELVTLTVNII